MLQGAWLALVRGTTCTGIKYDALFGMQYVGGILNWFTISGHGSQ